MKSKKECLHALETIMDTKLEEVDGLWWPIETVGQFRREECKTLGNLIHEHFENPGFSFEEIDCETPVFDKATQSWLLVQRKIGTAEDNPKMIAYIAEDQMIDEVEYEPNRFYAKPFLLEGSLG